MKLDKTLDLSGVVSRETVRPSLKEPYLMESGELVATNGHILAVLPGIKTDDDTAGVVTIEALKAAKGLDIIANGSLNVVRAGVKYERPSLERNYPDWAKIRDGAIIAAKPVVSLNADYIMALAKAIVEKGHTGRVVTLWEPTDGNTYDKPWILTPGGFKDGDKVNTAEPHAVIMPVRR